jgi:hypothetical protein
MSDARKAVTHFDFRALTRMTTGSSSLVLARRFVMDQPSLSATPHTPDIQ